MFFTSICDSFTITGLRNGNHCDNGMLLTQSTYRTLALFYPNQNVLTDSFACMSFNLMLKFPNIRRTLLNLEMFCTYNVTLDIQDKLPPLTLVNSYILGIFLRKIPLTNH